jgi:hypothetical protein
MPSPSKRNIIIWGAGGHASVVADIVGQLGRLETLPALTGRATVPVAVLAELAEARDSGCEERTDMRLTASQDRANLRVMVAAKSHSLQM